MMLTLTFLVALVLTGFSNAAITNRTIDDTNGDPGGATVDYGGAWNVGQKCPGCILQPEPNQLVDGTWHEATNDVHHPGDRNLTLTFTGTAIYIFCVLPNTPVQIPNYVVIAAANMTFTYDGFLINTFHRDPSPSQDYMYNFPVFSRTGLTNQEHTVVVQVLSQSYMGFDYAIYTFDDGESSSPPPPPTSSPSNDGPTTTAHTDTGGNAGPTTSDPPSSPSPTSVSSTGGPSTTSSPIDETTTSTTAHASGKSATIPRTGSLFSTASGSATTGSAPTKPATPGISARHSQKHTSTAAVAGAIVGGLAVLAAVIGVLLYCRRRSRRPSTAPVTQHGPGRTRIPALAPFNQFDAPSATIREKKAEPASTSDLHSETMPSTSSDAPPLDAAPSDATHSTNVESFAVAGTTEESGQGPGPVIRQVQAEAPGPVVQQVQDASQQAEIERLRVELQEALAMQVEAPPPYQW